MADFSLPGILDPIANIAAAGSVGEWISLGVYLIVSILASGIILVILLKILGSIWGEDYDMGRAFIVALVINIINFFGMGFIGPYISFIPLIVFSAILWIVLIKVFFREMEWLKVLITGIIGLVLSLVVAPILTGFIIGLLSPLLAIV